MLVIAQLSPACAREPATLPPGNIIVLGDSISAGYQLPMAQAWPNRIDRKIKNQNMPYNVINAGISGDTTAGGLQRLPNLLREYNPVLVVIELGANDALRGQNINASKQNLARIIELSQKSGSEILIVGVPLPPNYGPLYARQFDGMYSSLANDHDIALLPFGFDNVLNNRELFLADGLHPNAQGHKLIAEHIFTSLVTLFKLHGT